MERTLVVLKPDAIKRGLVGEITMRFERAGLKIVGMKMVAPDEEHFQRHYEEISQIISRWGREVFEINVALMQETPVVAIVLEGIEAVEHVRKMVGTTDPKQSPPGTIRGDYTHLTQNYARSQGRTLPNLIHASGNQKEAEAEIALWFTPDELHDYDTAVSSVVQGRVPKPKK